MKRTLTGFLVFSFVGVTLLSCSGYNSNAYHSRPSGLAHRLFISDPVFPTTTGATVPALVILDTSDDLLSPSIVPLIAATVSVNQAGMMAVSPDRTRTLVFSTSDTKLAIVSNGGESLTNTISLPAATESFVWSSNSTAFAALPTAPVSGQATGEVVRIDVTSAAITANIPIPGAHYIAPSPDGSKVLVFSDNSNTITLITPSLISAATSNSIPICSLSQVPVCTLPMSFDRPVTAVFDASSSTAYVLNCGPQCGGTSVGACLTFTSCTSVSVLDLTQSPPQLENSFPVPAATTALLQGNTLYVAGTPALAPDNDCSGVIPSTAATTCGRLTQINLQSLLTTSVAITDGYHTGMALSPNGQLFVGSKNCTNINVTGGEVRGCLTIANVSSGSIAASGVIAPSQNGDVTGLAVNTTRNVAYVSQGGRLRIYDVITDQLETNPTQPDVVGQAVDVKLADF